MTASSYTVNTGLHTESHYFSITDNNQEIKEVVLVLILDQCIQSIFPSMRHYSSSGSNFIASG